MAKKVILVDDSKTIIATAEMAFEDLMSNEDVEFKTYINPIELLNDLLNDKIDYDLLITDLNMPQMHGLNLIEKLKSNDKFKQKPILVLTTESSQALKIKGKELGVIGWMIKPFSDKKLIKSIKMVLGL